MPVPMKMDKRSTMMLSMRVPAANVPVVSGVTLPAVVVNETVPANAVTVLLFKS